MIQRDIQRRNLSQADRAKRAKLKEEAEQKIRKLGMIEIDEATGEERHVPTIELLTFLKDPKHFEKTVLEVKRHVNITAQGRVFSFSALVLLGNGTGGGSLGYGKGISTGKAISN